MRNKAGQLAVIVRPGKWLGWIVEVISHPAPGRFLAPDDTPFNNIRGTDWLIKAPRPFGARPYTKTCFALCGDKDMRPITDPGADATDETLLWLPAPSQQVEHA